MERTPVLFDTHVVHPVALRNSFRGAAVEQSPLPSFAEARSVLPEPFWEGHDTEITCYWRAWELAFCNLRSPDPRGAFIANYLDTAFNGHLFMWDSAFAMMFAQYGRRAFSFIRTLDNLYAAQHSDGFICRELDPVSGDFFERLSPASTGPDVLAWAEWEWYRLSGDQSRLATVFPVLLAYRDWSRRYRTWPDGTYFASGWGCGMDNQPRLPEGYHEWFDHGHMSWIDTTLQAIFADRVLCTIAETLGCTDQIRECADEAARLTDVVNTIMWNPETGMYTDRYRDGTLSSVKTIGAFWALVAGIAPADRVAVLCDHLRDQREFNRPHRVPSLSADHPLYDPCGGYWRGGVWPPTTYMVLRGLETVGDYDLAHEIGCNHVGNVTAVYRDTGTLWENYAPESAAPGHPAAPNFVGWSGLGPVAVLLEYVFGIRGDYVRRELTWNIRLVEEHGVRRYPWGPNHTLDLHCAARHDPNDEPCCTVLTDVPLTIEIRWPGGKKRQCVGPTLRSTEYKHQTVASIYR